MHCVCVGVCHNDDQQCSPPSIQTFYTSKSQSGMLAESEAGDSGVGSTAYGELHDFSDADPLTPLTISQEDISEGLLSPKRSLTDSNGIVKISIPDRSLTGEATRLLLRENSSTSTFSRSSSSSLAMQVPNSVTAGTVNGIDE